MMALSLAPAGLELAVRESPQPIGQLQEPWPMHAQSVDFSW